MGNSRLCLSGSGETRNKLQTGLWECGMAVTVTTISGAYGEDCSSQHVASIIYHWHKTIMYHACHMLVKGIRACNVDDLMKSGTQICDYGYVTFTNLHSERTFQIIHNSMDSLQTFCVF